MKHIKIAILTGSILTGLLFAGCGSSAVVIDEESATSSIRAAKEVGAGGISDASLYLQLAKEQLVKAQNFAENGKKKEADSMLLRASADGELAVALSRNDADKKEALDAINRVDQLRKDNNLPKGRN